MKVIKTSPPSGSLISGYLPGDFTDAFEYTVEDSKGMLTPDKIQSVFWMHQPRWLKLLFKLRNIIVKPFGLKGNELKIERFKECIYSGGTYNMVTVPAKRPDETVIILNDKHLEAALSVHIKGIEGNRRKVTTSTVVHFHNNLGRTYFFVIHPFHNIVVRSMLKRSVNLALKHMDI